MVKTSGIFLNLLFLFVSFPYLSKEEDNNWLYERNKNIYCQRPSCDFNITYNNPYSPMILGNTLNRAVLNPYNYIYLWFSTYSRNKNTDQDVFYLEVYDINTGENLLSNGDCHLINLTSQEKYELQIYKPLYNDTIFVLKFSGINPQFSIRSTIMYEFSIYKMAMSFELTDKNSLYKSDINGLKKYEEEFNQKILELNDRKMKAISTANKIVYNLFGKTLKANLEYKLNTFLVTIPVWPFISLTITIATGMEVYSENILEPAKDEVFLTKFLSINGVIETGSDCFEKIGKKINLNSILLNVIKIFNKKINDFLYTIALDTEVFSLTIAASPINRYASLTFRFFDLETRKNFYEIQFKLELTFKLAFELVLANNNIFTEALNKVADFSDKYSNDLNRIIYAMIGIIILITLAILSLPLTMGAIPLLEKIADILIFKVPPLETTKFVALAGALT